MKRVYIFFLAITFAVGCTSSDKSTSAKNNSESLKKELDSAFKKMWQNVTLTNFANYAKTDVSDDFFSIGAGGVAENKDSCLPIQLCLGCLKFRNLNSSINK